MNDLYIDIFWESLLSATIFPNIYNFLSIIIGIVGINIPTISALNNSTFFAMHSFDQQGMKIPALFAITGSAIGMIFSFFIGRFIAKFYHKEGGEIHLSREKYFKASRFFSRYLIALLPFTWMPLLNILPIIAGFLDTKAKTVISLTVVGYVLYYGYYAIA